MQIDHLILGGIETNCYILRSAYSAEAAAKAGSAGAAECLIIDAELGAPGLVDFLKANNLQPAAVILTHGHPDHTGSIPSLRAEYPQIKVCIHKLDAEMLSDIHPAWPFMAPANASIGPAEIIIENQEQLQFAGITLRVLHTPGHTPGGICLYSQADGVIFTGDTLFAGSVGRTDFPNGDHKQLIAAIKDKLLVLPGRTIVYPGHGPQTTIAEEKATNPHLL